MQVDLPRKHVQINNRDFILRDWTPLMDDVISNSLTFMSLDGTFVLVWDKKKVTNFSPGLIITSFSCHSVTHGNFILHSAVVNEPCLHFHECFRQNS